jgi:hypothetical protein
VKGHSAQQHRGADRPEIAAHRDAVSSTDVRHHVSTAARRHSISWLGLALLLAGIMLGDAAAIAEPRVSTFTLTNGMQASGEERN